MNCRTVLASFLRLGLCAIPALVSLSCDEQLPTRVFPDKVLSMQVTIAEQLPDHLAMPGRQVVHIRITGQNIYDDVFQDQVDITGTMTIWWKRLPRYYRTVALTAHSMSNPDLIHGGKLTLLPGESFSMDVYWNLKGDDSLYFPHRMNWSESFNRLCSPNVLCGTAETFVIESSVQIFARIGVITVPPAEFRFVPRTCGDITLVPCSLPAPPGGGG